MTQAPAQRVGERKALAVGLVLTITTIAFENLGVATAMPVVARDLGDLSLYGWTFTAPLLASLIGIVVAGRAVDRLGPGRPFAIGLALFTVGLSIAGAAPSMEVLVAGRFVQGLGTGVIPPVAYAAIGRAFVDRARATMFALLSTAWVLPGVIGPAVSGTIAEEVGWRWVFAAILPLVPLNALLAIPPLLRLGAPTSDHPIDDADDRSRVPLAARLAVGVGLVVAGLGWRSLLAIPVVAGGLAIAAEPVRRLLPPGTVRAAEGLPAAIAARGLQTFAFFGAQAFLPLALEDVRGQRAAAAGVLLTAATLAWTAGAWLQERRGHLRGRAQFVRTGFACLVAGSAVSAAVLVDAVPIPLAALGWTIAGLGMGLSYSGLSLILLAAAPAGREGSATSALQLSDVLGMAVGTGLGGAAVAFGERAGASPRPGIAVAFGLALGAGAMACLAARRLPKEPNPPVLGGFNDLDGR
ncbi:MAG TPA: MFS transporter [Acidimicrobiales bacterium]|nr:MFS transporter [Acidimicrobiales bacterium]